MLELIIGYRHCCRDEVVPFSATGLFRFGEESAFLIYLIYINLIQIKLIQTKSIKIEMV